MHILSPRASSRPLQLSTRIIRAPRRCTALFQIQECCMPAKPVAVVNTSPCHPHLTLTTLEPFLHQLSRRNVRRFSISIFLAFSVPLLSFYVDDRALQRSLRSQLLVQTKRRANELWRLSRILLRNRLRVAQIMWKNLRSLVTRSEPCQIYTAQVRDLRNSFRSVFCTQFTRLD